MTEPNQKEAGAVDKVAEFDGGHCVHWCQPSVTSMCLWCWYINLIPDEKQSKTPAVEEQKQPEAEMQEAEEQSMETNTADDTAQHQEKKKLDERKEAKVSPIWAHSTSSLSRLHLRSIGN